MMERAFGFSDKVEGVLQNEKGTGSVVERMAFEVDVEMTSLRTQKRSEFDANMQGDRIGKCCFSRTYDHSNVLPLVK